MAKAKPKRRQRPTKDEMTFAITTKKLEGWEKTRVTGITWLGYCFVSYMIYLSISELAGKVTTADMKLVVDGVHTSSGIGLLPVAVSILFGIGGIRYGLRQRKLRCDAVERLHP